MAIWLDPDFINKHINNNNDNLDIVKIINDTTSSVVNNLLTNTQIQKVELIGYTGATD